MARAASLDDLALIETAAEEAGRLALGYFRRSPQVWMKEGTSPVCEADLAADEFLRETLTAARPHYGWLSEETADSPDRLGRDRVFVVDPIDGTRAFLDGKDTWCVSVAVVERGRPLAGVLACPALGETYVAVRGGGARRNGAPLGAPARRDRPMLAGPKRMLDALPHDLRTGADIHPYVPSLAYRIAMIAAGTVDASFVKENSHDWDLAAADLVLEEAGGAVRDASGRRLGYAGRDPRHGVLAAGREPMLTEMTRVLAALG